MRPSTPSILVISTSPVGPSMTGVGIRAYELARVLAAVGRVVIAAPDSPESFGGIPVIRYEHRRPGALKGPVFAADVIVGQPQWPAAASWVRRSKARVVFDLYDPEIFENLEFFADSGQRFPGLWTTLTVDRLADAVHRGDFFMCATNAQRDLWLGTMVAERIITPGLYADDPTLRTLLATVPFGLPDEPCVRVPGGGIREHVPGLPDAAEIVLWNGGIWGWLDAASVIRAIGLVRESRPAAVLVFMGASTHPAAATAAREAEGLAAEMGLLDTGVFFHSDWVPYEQRANWLLDASCAASAHADHLETRFAFRTRMLDCFWSGLPIVCTRGDALADLVERRGLGAVADPTDVEGLAAGISAVLDNGRAAYTAAMAAVAREHEWRVVAEPLVEFVRREANRAGVRHRRPRLAVRARSIAHRSASGVINAAQRAAASTRRGD